MPSICRQPIFGALRDQASDVILTGIPEQRSTKTRNRRTSDQSESGKHDEVLQMFSLNVNLLTNLPMGPIDIAPNHVNVTNTCSKSSDSDNFGVNYKDTGVQYETDVLDTISFPDFSYLSRNLLGTNYDHSYDRYSENHSTFRIACVSCDYCAHR